MRPSPSPQGSCDTSENWAMTTIIFSVVPTKSSLIIVVPYSYINYSTYCEHSFTFYFNFFITSSAASLPVITAIGKPDGENVHCPA